MKREEIAKRCFAVREQLIDKYCGSLPKDHAIELEQIGSLVEKLEEEYKRFLAELWEQVKGNDTRSLDDILDKRYNRFALHVEYAAPLNMAVANAEEVTLWEQITNSNYRDIEHLDTMISAYARDFLAHITLDFMEDVKISDDENSTIK